MKVAMSHDYESPIGYGHIEDRGDSVTLVVDRWVPCSRCHHQYRHHAVTAEGYRCRACKCKRGYWR